MKLLPESQRMRLVELVDKHGIDRVAFWWSMTPRTLRHACVGISIPDDDCRTLTLMLASSPPLPMELKCRS